ncbi:MAG: hypothetical protein JWM11_1129, partial [Planctomycetaceae bacterium]|nr:hypothetical protein [Planctomycetaceae bacterium]
KSCLFPDFQLTLQTTFAAAAGMRSAKAGIHGGMHDGRGASNRSKIFLISLRIDA